MPHLQHFSLQNDPHVNSKNPSLSPYDPFLRAYSGQLRTLELNELRLHLLDMRTGLPAVFSCSKLTKLVLHSLSPRQPLTAPTDSAWHDVLPPLPLLPHLHTLELQLSCMHTSAQLCWLLSACCALRHLELRKVYEFAALPVVGRARLCPHLVKLLMHDCELGLPAHYDDCQAETKHSKPTSLSGSFPNSHSFPALEAASIVGVHSDRSEPAERVARVAQLLSSAPRLQHIHLRAQDDEPLTLSDVLPFVTLPCLRSLGGFSSSYEHSDWVHPSMEYVWPEEGSSTPRGTLQHLHHLLNEHVRGGQEESVEAFVARMPWLDAYTSRSEYARCLPGTAYAFIVLRLKDRETFFEAIQRSGQQHDDEEEEAEEQEVEEQEKREQERSSSKL